MVESPPSVDDSDQHSSSSRDGERRQGGVVVDFVELKNTKKLVRCDVVCPDLIFSNWLETIPKEKLRLVEGEKGILGKGAYGTVVRGFLSEDIGSSLGPGGEQKKKCSQETKVAVKMLSIGGGSGGGEGKEWEFIQSLRHELFVMSALRSSQCCWFTGSLYDGNRGRREIAQWLVLELVEGGDLYGQLVDPFSMENCLKRFFEKFAQSYIAMVSHKCDPSSSEKELQSVMNHIEPLEQIGNEIGDKEFHNHLSSMREGAVLKWQKKDKESHEIYCQAHEQVFFFLFLILQSNPHSLFMCSICYLISLFLYFNLLGIPVNITICISP